MFSLSPNTGGPAAWEASSFPLHSPRASSWRHGWAVIKNVQSRAELNYWKKLVLEPSVTGRQMLILCTRALKAADALPLLSSKYFPSKDSNKEFQNCLIIMDVYWEYQNGEHFQKVLSKHLLKTWSRGPLNPSEKSSLNFICSFFLNCHFSNWSLPDWSLSANLLG